MEPKRIKLDHGLAEQPDPDEVRRELALILGSTSFRASRRCHDFLGHVVMKALEGETDTLKERTLAVEVFGRRADTDLGEDSIVRVGAREVRKRLAQYYVTDGANDALRIDLPAGSYVPTFRRHGTAQEGQRTAEPLHVPKPPAPVPPKRRSRWLAAAAIAVVTAASVAWALAHRPRGPFDEFWAPVFDQQSPVLIALAHPIVYHPSSRANQLHDERNGRPALAVQHIINVPPELLNGSDYVPVLDQYVGFGDSVAVSRLSGMFARRDRSSRLRLASKLDFADMRDSVSLLIGAFTNRWTMELSQNLRYHFGYSVVKPSIVDSQDGRHWTLTGKSDNGQSNEDYILICRLPRAQTGGFVIIAAGLTQYGTQEAGRILSDPDGLAPLLRKLPPAWRTKNVELLLHSQVVGDAPTPPELVASYIW